MSELAETSMLGRLSNREPYLIEGGNDLEPMRTFTFLPESFPAWTTVRHPTIAFR